jgi:hypothetical protein
MKQKPSTRLLRSIEPLRTLIIVSLALNLVLAIILMTQKATVASRFQTVQVTNSLPREQAKFPSRRMRQTAPAMSEAVAGFTWRDVESTDYRQYVANLRTIGCPEQTVRDIVLAELNDLYSTWLQSTGRGPEIRKFWQKAKARPGPLDPNSARAMRKEKLTLAEQIIGSTVEPYDLALMIGIHSERVDLAFLPEEKREPAYRALSDVKRTDVLDEDVEEVFRRKVAALSSVLSAEELEEYRMRRGPGASLEKRNQRLEELHSATEAKLIPILGQKGLTMAKLGNAWLQNPTMTFGQ